MKYITNMEKLKISTSMLMKIILYWNRNHANMLIKLNHFEAIISQNGNQAKFLYKKEFHQYINTYAHPYPYIETMEPKMNRHQTKIEQKEKL